ncbi:unnamed protein product [Umbelopsis ramanniana]
MVRPKRFVGGKRKSVNGSSVCYNHLCPTYVLGNNTKNRDVEAAKCIAIGAMTILLHGAALSPFAFRHNKPSQSHTGIQNLNQVPRQDGGRRATLVPAPGVYFKYV